MPPLLHFCLCAERPGPQLDQRAHLKGELREPSAEGALYSGQLLSNHRQHLNVNAVELIKAAPGAALCQPCRDQPVSC